MTAILTETMHTDHQQWLNDQAMWRDELEVWEKEAAKATQDLKGLENALREHELGLREHGNMIARQGIAVRGHEEAMARFEQEGVDHHLEERARRHHHQAALHEQLRDAHESFKRHHHIMLVRWSQMLKALGDKPDDAASTR